MVPIESLDTVSYSHPIVTMALSYILLEIKRDIARKSRFFIAVDPPPVRGVPVGILSYRMVWKNENSGATRWLKKV